MKWHILAKSADFAAKTIQANFGPFKITIRSNTSEQLLGKLIFKRKWPCLAKPPHRLEPTNN